jgi:hypothetical protein
VFDKGGWVLTAAALGMAAYGTFEVIIALTQVVNGLTIEWWALVLLAACGTVLVAAAAFVRVRLPGGVALALGALSIHSALHDYGRVIIPIQVARGTVAILLIALAYAGTRRRR